LQFNKKRNHLRWIQTIGHECRLCTLHLPQIAKRALASRFDTNRSVPDCSYCCLMHVDISVLQCIHSEPCHSPYRASHEFHLLRTSIRTPLQTTVFPPTSLSVPVGCPDSAPKDPIQFNAFAACSLRHPVRRLGHWLRSFRASKKASCVGTSISRVLECVHRRTYRHVRSRRTWDEHDSVRDFASRSSSYSILGPCLQ
jgi:hypothetical protein